jgi:hypothetical protein
MSLRQTATSLLFLIPLWSTPAAALDLRSLAERHAAADADRAVPPAVAPSQNPNERVAKVLGGVGAAMVLWGVVYKTGVECKDTSTSTAFGVQCGETMNKTLVFGGLAVAGAGGAMYLVGEGKKKSIGIGISPSGAGVRARVRF